MSETKRKFDVEPERIESLDIGTLIEKLPPEAIERILTIKLIAQILKSNNGVALPVIEDKKWRVPYAGQKLKVIGDNASTKHFIPYGSEITATALTNVSVSGKGLVAGVATTDQQGMNQQVLMSDVEPI